MEPRDTEPRLPIRRIENLNPAWVRDNVGVGEHDDLTKSLNVHGMRLPILLTEELVVADGARRLVRAKALGWRDVPVIITADWNVVTDYYRQARELEAAGEPHQPMTWQEIIRLIEGPIDALYHQRRLERGRESREANRLRRKNGEKAVNSTRKHDFIGEVADVLGWERSDLRSVRELFWSLETLRKQEEIRLSALTPKEREAETNRYELLLSQQHRLEQTGGGQEGGLYSLLNKVRLAARGVDPVTVKTGRAKRSLADPSYTQRKARVERAAQILQPTGRELDLATMSNLARMITNVGIEARGYTHLKPTIGSDDAIKAAKDVKAAVADLNGLARVLKAYAQLLEEKPA